MAMDEAGVLHDPFGGAKDIQQKIQKTTKNQHGHFYNLQPHSPRSRCYYEKIIRHYLVKKYLDTQNR